MTPFDIKKGIEAKKGMVWSEEVEAAYRPFVINRAFSFNPETLFCAQAMNEYPDIPPRTQFEFLYTVVPRGVRYDKWEKAETLEDEELVSDAYGVSGKEARMMLKTLTKEQLEQIKMKMKKGGKHGK